VESYSTTYSRAFDKNLRRLECNKEWFILQVCADFMVLSGSFLYMCTVIIRIIIIQNNRMKKHNNNVFFFMSMLCNRVEIEMGVNNDELLKTRGEHMGEIKKKDARRYS
jgi:hypothetical protein